MLAGPAVDIDVREGRIARVAPAGRGAVDVGGAEFLLGPTLCDIQVNGAAGIDLQADALRVDDVVALNRRLRAWGVACWIPTLITGPLDAMAHGCRTLRAAMAHPEIGGAIPGIHLEGPWISPEDGPRGAHPRAHVLPPRLRDFDRLWRAADGAIRYVTLAPELPGMPTFIRQLTARGVVVALGHHEANAAQVSAAADAGARLCTHLGNGLRPLIHRHHNPLWPQLADDRLAAALIADLHHLPPEVLRAFIRVKGARNTILVSDAVALTGCRPGPYTLFGAPVRLRPDGRICLEGTELLAGSGQMLLEGVVNAARHGGLSLPQAFAAASRNPARLLGIRRRFPAPRVGARADFVLADGRAARVRPAVVYTNGEEIPMETGGAV